MKSLKVSMTVDEFDLMPQKFGWKHEYWKGFARVSPRHNGVFVKVPITKRDVLTHFEIQPISAIGLDELRELFYASFKNSVEYCDYKQIDLKQSAKKNIDHFFDGKRGLPQLDLSRVAVIPKRKKPFVAACLVSRYKYGFKNEILFVRPQFQNRGIGTALVSNVINDLREIGKTFLWSEYQICNEQSAKWHEKFGFVEEPDILVTRLRYHFLKCEIWRNEKLGCVAETQKLKISLEKVEAELDVLAELESSDFNAARSFWRYDF